jgi:hypothetical protein
MMTMDLDEQVPDKSLDIIKDWMILLNGPSKVNFGN